MTQPELSSPSSTTDSPDAGPEDTRGGPKSAARSLGPAIVVVAVVVAVSVVTGSFPTVAFVFAIIAMVTVHEAGHFVTAKLAGMKVTQFFFGFGPRLWSVRRGETEYGVKALPVGGYVKIIGMSNLERDIDPADEPRTYRAQSYPRRLSVALAGVATHFINAFLLLVLLWAVVGVPSDRLPTTTVGSISRLSTGESPAQAAGFQVGDRIVSVEGRPVSRWEDVRDHIRSHPGEAVSFVVDRRGQKVDLTAVPADHNPDGERVGFLGLAARPAIERVGALTAVGRAGRDVAEFSVGTVKALGDFFSPGSLSSYSHQLTGESRGGSRSQDDNRPVSVVGLARIAGQAAESGAFNVVYLLVILNVFVGIFNLVPLLPLDGGHVAIATYERLRSRRGRQYRADVAKMLPVTAAVVAIMGFFLLTTVWLDIVHPVANPFR